MDATTEAYNQVPCASCGSWQRDRVLTKLILFYLACERGESPKLSRADLMRGCCRQQAGDSITYNIPSELERARAEGPPWKHR